MNKRYFFVVALIGIVGFSAAYYSLSDPRPQIQEKKVLQLISNGNFASAEVMLQKTSAKKLPFPSSFYKGMLAQLKGKFAESHLLFQSALKSSKEEKDHLLLEISFAEMSNAYLEQKEKDFSLYLDALRNLDSSHPQLLFFEGLSFYLQKKYEKAADIWKSFDLAQMPVQGKWGFCVFNHLFPKHFRQLFYANSLIESNDLLKGREILEKEKHFSSEDENFQDLTTLFLGLSYLKESQSLPIEQRGSYYQLACFYFDKSQKKFTLERKQLSYHLQKEVESLLNLAQTEQQKKWALDFIQILQQWKDFAALKNLSEIASQHILMKKDLVLCELLNERFAHAEFHNLITENLLSALTEKLKCSHDLSETWDMAEILSEYNKELATGIADLSRAEIFDAINQDDKTLSLTRQYIRFWEKFNTELYEKRHFGRDLLGLSKLLWQTEGQEDKGLSLMDIAMELDSELKIEIESFLTHLYSDAENCNMIRRLSFIYEALEYFGINRKEFTTPCKIANYLADAEYFYYARNYFCAKIQAGWVLKLDPQNEQALRLVGLSSFHLGEYTQATYALNQLSNPDEYVSKALILSQVYSSENSEKHLVQIDNSGTFDKDE